MSEERILMGVIGRPAGVHGLVHVISYTAKPEDLAAYGPLWDEMGRRWTLKWRSVGVAELRDVAGQSLTDRNAAEKLVNTRLFIDRAKLPPPGNDEFYLADLVGLVATAPEGDALGRVALVHDYGAGISLEIAGDGPGMMVPFTLACIPTIDLVAGRLVVVPPAEVTVTEHTQ